jgi:lipopolysaccharide biosynthesis glycosyltransferase
MNVAIAFSANWSTYVAVEMYALFVKNKVPTKVYLLSDNLEQSHLDEFDTVCAMCGEDYTYEYINLLKMYEEYMPSGINVDTRFSKYTLYRLFLPNIINDDRVLYIDADAIVASDISHFYNTEMEGYLLAGVEDTGLPQGYKTNLGIPEDAYYINAGVTLINLDAIRKLNLCDTWINMANTKFYDCHDQDIFNITCNEKIKKMHYKYNTSLSTSLEIKVENIKIMHYAGAKPWNTKQVPFYEIWNRWQTIYDLKKSLMMQHIPKTIHYCWFGGAEKPAKIQKCLDSWTKYLPDYEIIEWNETNFDINCCAYVKEAYDKKKWAFVTDFVRLWALYTYGGIYMDSDVEVVKNLDEFLNHRAFTGHEADKFLITATMGAEIGHPWIKMLLAYYDTAKLEANPIPNTHTITRLSFPWIVGQGDGFTFLRESVVIYPTEVFCPYDHSKLVATPTPSTYTIHHFAGSWLGRKEKE